METVIIQKLIGPSKEVCNEWGMYFRKVDAEGNDVTKKMMDYLIPLIQGEAKPAYQNGIPVHLALYE